ncbi:MAG: TAXI family TRAP transporter solute-binding subunit [Pseudomonadota bacterium]
MSLRKIFAVAALAACCALAGLAPAQAEVKSFTITAGPMGGDWYSIGGAMGEMAKQSFPGAIVTVTTGGALANVAKVNAGKADVGLSMAKLYAEALAGKGKYQGKKMENLRAVAFLAYIPMSYFLVKADNSLASIEEIKAKKMPIRILTSKKGSSPSLAAELMLAQYGITFDDIKKWGGSVSFVSYAEASNLIKDGHADAWVGPMVSAIVELTTTTKMKQLPVKPAFLDKLQKDFNYATVVLPKGKYYFITKDTPQMAEAVIVITQKKLGEAEVYKFTSELMKNAARIQGIHKTYSGFNPATAWQNVGGPLHPGAHQYYKEKGYLK